MSRLLELPTHEALAALAKFGFYVKRQASSHIVLRRDEPWSQVVVPIHSQLDRGILHAILRQAGISAEEFSNSVRPEILTASTLSILAVAKSSAHQDQFASWLLGGFAAGFGLLLANQQAIDLCGGQLRWLTKAFLFIALLTVAEKYLATILAAGGQAAREGLDLAEKLPAAPYERLLGAMTKATARPARWLLEWQMKKMKADDFLAPARLFSCLVQFQGLCLFFQAAAVFLAAAWFAWSLSG